MNNYTTKNTTYQARPTNCFSGKLFEKPSAAFTPQTKVDKLVLANSSWRVLKPQQQSANMLTVSKSRLPIVHTSKTSLPTRKSW